MTHWGPAWAELKPRLQQLAADLGEPLRALDELTDAEGDRLAWACPAKGCFRRSAGVAACRLWRRHRI